MTCIVGVQHKCEVWIGGDSAGVAGLNMTVRSDPKVFVNGPMVFGFTSSFRMGQVLAHALKVPTQPKDKTDFAWLVTDFVDVVRAIFSAKGWDEKKDNRQIGGDFLIGYKGNLYRIADDFQIGKSARDFDAIGCGGEVALGAMFATTGAPEARLRTALKAAQQFSAGVRGPFRIIKGGKKDK